jgi:hypothetical protein
MKSFIVAILAVMVMATGAMAAENEGWVEIRHAVNFENPEFNSNNLVTEVKYRHEIIGPVGIDFGAVGNPTKDVNDAIISVGPQVNMGKFLFFDSFEASATTSFTTGDVGEFGQNGLVRIRGNF